MLSGMADHGNNKVSLHVLVPPAMRREVEDLADATGEGLAVVVRMLLRQGLDAMRGNGKAA